MPNEVAIFLPLRLFRSPLTMPESLAGDERERGVGAELGGVAAEVAEEHQVHAAQDGADGRHAGLHHVGLARLQRVERIDAGGVGARDRHVEPVLLEEAALDRDRQRQHVDGGHHADLEFHGILGLRQRQRRQQQQGAEQHQQYVAFVSSSWWQRLDAPHPVRPGDGRRGPLVSLPELQRRFLVSRTPCRRSGTAERENAPAGTAA